MIPILLDTHIVWVGSVSGDTTLKPAARQLIENAYKDRTITLSAISVWEIAVLVAKRKLVLNLPVSD